MIRAARIFGRVWLTLAFALILFGYGATWYLRGWAAMQELSSPWNVWNFIAVGVTVAPGILALKWADRAEARKAR
jgi:cytochrome bd-type quinol oxidase subunit 2